MNTTISVSRRSRNELARIAKDELHGASMDDALTAVLEQRRRLLAFESERRVRWAEVADPESSAEKELLEGTLDDGID